MIGVFLAHRLELLGIIGIDLHDFIAQIACFVEPVVFFLADDAGGESVVIHTGTNGPADPDGIASILRSLRDRDVVVLVTVNTPHWWMTDSNRVLNDAAQRWPNVRLADWAAVSRGHPEYFVADGTHLTSAGIDAYARLIRQTLRGDAAVALD